MFGGGSVSDPYRITDPRLTIAGISPDYANLAGRTLVNPRSLSGRIKNRIEAGQSNIANTGQGGFYTVLNPTKVLNLNSLDGGLYQMGDPMLGAGGSNSCLSGKLGDKLIADNYCDFAISLNVAVGSSSIAMWKVGGPFNDRIGAAFRRYASVGLTVTEFLFQLGETDNFLGTSLVDCTAGFASVVATVRQFSACTILISTTSWFGGATASNVTTAQAAARDNVTIFAGANTDTLDATYRTAGTPDFTYNGMTTVANLWATAIEAH